MEEDNLQHKSWIALATALTLYGCGSSSDPTEPSVPEATAPAEEVPTPEPPFFTTFPVDEDAVTDIRDYLVESPALQLVEVSDDQVLTTIEDINRHSLDAYQEVISNSRRNWGENSLSLVAGFEEIRAQAMVGLGERNSSVANMIDSRQSDEQLNASLLEIQKVIWQTLPPEQHTKTNHVWLQTNYPLDRQYLSELESYYNAKLEPADFITNSDTVEDLIGQWFVAHSGSYHWGYAASKTRVVQATTSYTNLNWHESNVVEAIFEYAEDYGTSNDELLDNIYPGKVAAIAIKNSAVRSANTEFEQFDIALGSSKLILRVIMPFHGHFDAVEQTYIEGNLADTVALPLDEADAVILPCISFEKSDLEPEDTSFYDSDFERINTYGALELSVYNQFSKITLNKHGITKEFNQSMSLQGTAEENYYFAGAIGDGSGWYKVTPHIDTTGIQSIIRPFIFELRDPTTDVVINNGRVRRLVSSETLAEDLESCRN
ncbi:serpin family protein [Corallincola spongiicola]|nr:serpin family protein [Corallincola spongiicola]